MVLDKLPPKWKWPAIFVGVAIFIIALLAATKPTPPKSEVSEKEWLVSADTLAFSNISPELELLGVVQSPFVSDLSAAISADVAEVPVREGNFVLKDQILIELDQRDIDLTIAQREADVSDLQAQITNEQNRFEADKAALAQEKSLMAIAKKSVQRQAKLQKANLVAQERYDQAASEQARNSLAVTSRELAIKDHPSRLAQLRARLARAQTALNDAKLDAERSHIRAPFDGVVTEVNVAPGERVQIGQVLLKMYDQTRMEVRAQVPDRFVTPIQQALSQHQSIKALTNNYGVASGLELSRLSGAANRGAGGIDALFVQSDLDTTLILNSTLKLQVVLPALENVTSLPVSSIYGTNRVYRVEEGRIRSLNVDILGRQFSNDGPDRVLIQGEDIQPGDQIITTQLPNAISGLKVKVRES